MTLLRQQIAAPSWQNRHSGSSVLGDLTAAAILAAQSPGLHEIRPSSYRDTPAGIGFGCALAAMAAAARPGAIVWIAQNRGALDSGLPYGPGLRRFGLDPARVLLVRAAHDGEALWAAEEAARASGVAVVLAQTLGAVSLTAARRLHLSALTRVFLGMLRPAQTEGLGPALTRWTTAGAGGTSPHLASWAVARWRVALDRRRDGPPIFANILEWDHAAHRLRLGAGLELSPSTRPAPVFHTPFSGARGDAWRRRTARG